MSKQAITLKEKLNQFNEHWQPRVIAEMNDYQFKLVKIQGEFVWHSHADTDETFLVIEGSMRLQLQDTDIKLNAGDLYVVKKGIQHRPVAEQECKLMLIEPRGVLNTGDAGGERTAQNIWL